MHEVIEIYEANPNVRGINLEMKYVINNTGTSRISLRWWYCYPSLNACRRYLYMGTKLVTYRS